MFKDIEGVKHIADNIFVWGEYEQQHDATLIKILERAHSRNLKLNKTKFQMKRNRLLT